VPWRPNGTKRADVTNPEHRGTLEQARMRADALSKPFGKGGVGTVLTEIGANLVLMGLDLDTCRSPQSGKIADWAASVVERFDSYAEVSPSGRGLKLWALMRKADRDAILTEIQQAGGNEEGTKWARRGGEHPPAIELFLGRRYFTYTGHRLDGAPEALRVVPPETLLWLLHEAGPAFKSEDGPEAGYGPRDESRSAAAFRLGMAAFRQGKTYEEFREAVKADPETAEWYSEKGQLRDKRELKRIWQKAQDSDDDQIVVIDGDRHLAAELAMQKLVAAGAAIYQRAGSLVQVAQVPTKRPGGGIVKVPQIVSVAKPTLASEMAKVATW
jgi:hypothetical protein